MCDFYSTICRRDGAIFHRPHNSHSTMVSDAGWTENNQVSQLRGEMRFVEVEWKFDQDFPGAPKVARGEINEKQRKAIDLHYGNLGKLLKDPAEHAERMLTGNGFFGGPEYADIRWKVMTDPRVSPEVAAKLAELPVWADGSAVGFLPDNLKEISGGGFILAEIAPLTAPALTEVSGYIDVRANATLTAPAITEVSGYIDVRANASFTAPALTKSGSIYVSENASFTAPALTKSGSIDVSKSAKVHAPNLGYTTGS